MAEEWYEGVMSLFKKGKPEEAHAILEEIARISPEDAEGYVKRVILS